MDAAHFEPLPASRVFSRRGYRLTEASPVLPVALLAVLRAAGRAPAPFQELGARQASSGSLSMAMPVPPVTPRMQARRGDVLEVR